MSNGSVKDVLEAAGRKQPYHSDLAKAGQLKLQFKHDPQKSQWDHKGDGYPGRPEHRVYTHLKVEEPDGSVEDYAYEPDTQRVVEAIEASPKNTWLLVEFDGGMEDAEILILDLGGNVVADTSGEREPEVTKGQAHQAGRPAPPPGGPEGEGGAEVTCAHVALDAMLNASAVLSRFVEEIGRTPPDGETPPDHVGYVPLPEWVRLCKELGIALMIRQERTGLPIGPTAVESAEGYDRGGTEEDPSKIPVTGETIRRVETLSELVWDDLSEKQKEEVGAILDGKVTEKAARAAIRALTERVNASAGVDD